MSSERNLDGSTVFRAVIGLGNPGTQYRQTRHNAGFQVVDRLDEEFRGSGWRRKTKGWLTEIDMKCERMLLFKPSGYMNLSGPAVSVLCQTYNLKLTELIVVHDDLDIDPGQIRIKKCGGHGGHKGVRSIIETLGSDAFCRVRVGIGKPVNEKNTVDFVLSSPENKTDGLLFRESVELARQAIETIILNDLQTAMERFNKKNKPTLLSN